MELVCTRTSETSVTLPTATQHNDVSEETALRVTTVDIDVRHVPASSSSLEALRWRGYWRLSGPDSQLPGA
jgi:hypothetical protein